MEQSKTFNARIKNKRDTHINWTNNNPVLLNGEFIIVDMPNGDIRTKIGNGISTYTELLFESKVYVQDEEPLDSVDGDIWITTE